MEQKQQEQLIVLIDNGHGSDTPGKRSPVWPDGTQLMEYDFNRKVAKKLFDMCAQTASLKPVLLVPEKHDVSITNRIIRASKYSPANSILLSIHGNAGPEPASGFEIFTSPGQTKSDKLAEFIWQAVNDVPELNMKMRSETSDGDHDKEERFSIIAKTKMPAILSENGFFTNEAECHKMMTDEFQELIALCHLRGILAYDRWLRKQ